MRDTNVPHHDTAHDAHVSGGNNSGSLWGVLESWRSRKWETLTRIRRCYLLTNFSRFVQFLNFTLKTALFFFQYRDLNLYDKFRHEPFKIIDLRIQYTRLDESQANVTDDETLLSTVPTVCDCQRLSQVAGSRCEPTKTRRSKDAEGIPPCPNNKPKYKMHRVPFFR